MKEPEAAPDLLTLCGGCHCGKVRFEVKTPQTVVVHHCNCSICTMTGFVHLIVPADRFTLTSGQSELSEYRFNTGVARHFFCPQCGVKSFYVPRSNPDGYSVNASCLDVPHGLNISAENFDGRNWRASSAKLRHLTNQEPS